eukprot:UN26497
MIDLAGSERQKKTKAKGSRLKEANEINKSLTTLGMVIQGLVKKANNPKQFIHYRDSVLTYLLKESLGGNSLTYMIATLNPSLQQLSETVSTLKFAERAKKIQNKARLNANQHGSTQALTKEIERLKRTIAKYKSENTKLRGGSASVNGDFMDLDTRDPRGSSFGAWQEELTRLAKMTESYTSELTVLRKNYSDINKSCEIKDERILHYKSLYEMRSTSLDEIRIMLLNQESEEGKIAHFQKEIEKLEIQLQSNR